MRGSLTKLSACAILGVATLFGGAAHAAIMDIQIDKITATWSDPVGGSGIEIGTIDAAVFGGDNPNAAIVSWGSTSGGGRSAYLFDADPVPISSGPGIFEFADFIHANQAIPLSAAIDAVSLSLEIEGHLTGGGPGFALSTDLTFDHTETENSGRCAPAGATVCPDVVSITANPGDAALFSFMGVDYTVAFLGFDGAVNGVSSFVTEERQNNVAPLSLSFSAVTAPVPLPAAGWMLIGGLALLGRTAGRRRSAG